MQAAGACRRSSTRERSMAGSPPDVLALMVRSYLGAASANRRPPCEEQACSSGRQARYTPSGRRHEPVAPADQDVGARPAYAMSLAAGSALMPTKICARPDDRLKSPDERFSLNLTFVRKEDFFAGYRRMQLGRRSGSTFSSSPMMPRIDAIRLRASATDRQPSRGVKSTRYAACATIACPPPGGEGRGSMTRDLSTRVDENGPQAAPEFASMRITMQQHRTEIWRPRRGPQRPTFIALVGPRLGHARAQLSGGALGRSNTGRRSRQRDSGSRPGRRRHPDGCSWARPVKAVR